jgi:sugar phosphate isomerase/epimerase
MQKIEEFAKERGMNIEFGKATQARFQEIYDNANEISKMQEIEEFAKERDMNIEFGKATQDRIREIFDSANNISEIQEIEEFAKERGIKLGKTTQDRIREIFDSANNISEIQEIEEFAKERGIKLGKTTQDKLQEIYCYNAQWDKTDKLKEIEEFAKERGIKLEIQDSFQKIFDAEASDKTQGGLAAYHISRNLKAAEKLGIKIEIKKEIIQQAFENLCVAFGEDSLDAENIEEVQQIAQSNGIELENVKELIERAYIGMVHNTEMGHVDSRRDKFLEMLQEIGSNLTYKDVAKMDYLKYLEVPKNEILDIEKTITINDSSINVVFHGKKGVKFFDDMEVRVSVGMKGKFIMGTTKDDNLKFVFDSTLGEHADIATKYDLKALGGGWLQIDEQNKRIVIFGESQKFGVEPRSISRQIVADVFPEYKLSVE